MSAPGSGSVGETIISQMVIDASKYSQGADEIVRQDARLIASYNSVTRAYNDMRAAIAQGLPVGASVGGGSGGGGGYRGSGSNGSNPAFIGPPIPPPTPPWGNTAYPPAGWRPGKPPVFTGQNDDSQQGSQLMGLGPAYLALRAIRALLHAFEDLARGMEHVAVQALHEYASFDTLEKSFIGLYGSSQLANQAVNYLRDTAMISAFHFRDLADAMRGLAVAGLDVNRFLPIVQGFALAMGHVDGTGLEDFISILRRLQGGNTGLALGPRGIGRYGVSRQELENYGATFDTHGHFTGSINEAFDAIEGVFNARIKGIADSVQKSFEVTMSNAKDAVQQASIDFGQGLAGTLTGPIQDATVALNGLRKAGVLQDLGNTIGGILTSNFDMGRPNPFTFEPRKGESEEAADARRRKEIHAYIKQRFDFGEDEKGRLGYRSGGDPSTNLLIDIGTGIVELVAIGKEMYTGTVILVNCVGRILQFFTGIEWKDLGGAFGVPTPDEYGQDFARRARAMLAKSTMEGLLNPDGSPKAPDTPKPAGQDDDFIEANQHLKHIRHSTERIANHFDSRSTQLGGGDIGRYGANPVEMSKYWSSPQSSGGIQHIMANAGNALASAVQHEIQNAFRMGLQQGLFMPRGG